MNTKNLTYEDLAAAVATNDAGRLAPFRTFAKSVIGKRLNGNVPNHDLIIEEIAEDSVIDLIVNMGKWDPDGGLAFSSFFYTRINWTFSAYLKKNGIVMSGRDSAGCDGEDAHGRGTACGHSRLYDAEDDAEVAEMSNPDTYTHPDEGHAGRFSREMIPYIREFVDMLPPIKKRIFMARWQVALDPSFIAKAGALESGYGYAKALSQELGREGVNMSRGAIKSMLSDMLKELGGYLVRRTGISLGEFRDNLTQFIVVDKESSLREQARDMLFTLDVATLSDDDAAWLLVQFLR